MEGDLWGREEENRRGRKGGGCMTNKEQWAGVMDRTEGENENGRERSIGKMVKESIAVSYTHLTLPTNREV